jgi:hypothetical protein
MRNDQLEQIAFHTGVGSSRNCCRISDDKSIPLRSRALMIACMTNGSQTATSLLVSTMPSVNSMLCKIACLAVMNRLVSQCARHSAQTRINAERTASYCCEINRSHCATAIRRHRVRRIVDIAQTVLWRCCRRLCSQQNTTQSLHRNEVDLATHERNRATSRPASGDSVSATRTHHRR